jgi:hypothetical protein
MIRDLVRGGAATDYGDPVFDHVQGPGSPSERTRRRYRRNWGSRGGGRWFEASFQHDVDVAALVNGGRSYGAALQWLRDHPEERANKAPPPRNRQRSA